MELRASTPLGGMIRMRYFPFVHYYSTELVQGQGLKVMTALKYLNIFWIYEHLLALISQKNLES